MRAVFFDGQNAGHIGKGNIFLVLQPVPQKVQILVLLLLVIFLLAEDAVPFINDDDKLPLRFGINILHGFNQVIGIEEVNILIFTQ